ncbi:MAG: GNAT family N-acetyltransferase [Myxococcota bacterium]
MAETRSIPREEALIFNEEHWPAHNLRQGIDWKQSEHAFGAFEDGRLCGVAYYKVVGGMAYLEQIVVADGLTKRGLGSTLMKAFESHASELGCHVIQLETAETQAPGFYERLGYERIGTYSDGRFHLDWHLYRKEIPQAAR